MSESQTPLHPGVAGVETVPISEPAETRREAPQLSPELLKSDYLPVAEIRRRKEIHHNHSQYNRQKAMPAGPTQLTADMKVQRLLFATAFCIPATAKAPLYS